MGNLEALGDAVTGGVVGRAVEPKAGEAADGHFHETHCLNCGGLLAGPFCHECGQHAHVHRTLAAFFHDFLHGVLHFEGKIWRTLPLLAWKPGELTRRYIEGQRASFISPIALFLFSVFLMFAVVGLTGGFKANRSAAAQQDVAQEIRADQAKVRDLQVQRAAAVKAGRPTAAIDEQLTDARAELAALSIVKSGPISGNPIPVGSSPIEVSKSTDVPAWLRDGISSAQKNPDLVLYKLKTNAYKFSWLLIPISVPFVWLLFPLSRRFRLYDHTVFVTYSLCFMSLLVVAWLIFGAIGLAGVAGLLMLVPPFHMYRQLKGAYGLSRFGALWRTVLLTLFALLAISLFTVLLVGVGLFD